MCPRSRCRSAGATQALLREVPAVWEVVDMTETEARTKWCPLSRVAAADGLGMIRENKPAHNRAYAIMDDQRIDIASCNCIASGCMFWRTQEIVTVPDNQNRDPRGAVVLTRTDGWCGVAGAMSRGVRHE